MDTQGYGIGLWRERVQRFNSGRRNLGKDVGITSGDVIKLISRIERLPELPMRSVLQCRQISPTYHWQVLIDRRAAKHPPHTCPITRAPNTLTERMVHDGGYAVVDDGVK